MTDSRVDPVASLITGKPTSKLMVLHSPTGYYIGRMQKFDECTWMPFTRESDYYLVERHAEAALVEHMTPLPVLMGV